MPVQQIKYKLVQCAAGQRRDREPASTKRTGLFAEIPENHEGTTMKKQINPSIKATVGSIQITVILNTGCNTLEFYNPIVGDWAPDFDQIQFNCPTCTVSAPTPTPTATPTTDGASNITSSSARLNGTVNPNALATTVHFQYGTRTNYGSTTANQTYTGNTTQSVSANIPRLRANTTYHFRLVETNNGGTRYGSDRTFRTFGPTGPPVVATSAATNVASFSATLNGSVYPHGLPTSVHFQYGTTTSYGFTTAPHTNTGNRYQSVSANISGLSASTTYHFRIVTTNSAGTRSGSDQTPLPRSSTKGGHYRNPNTGNQYVRHK